MIGGNAAAHAVANVLRHQRHQRVHIPDRQVAELSRLERRIDSHAAES